MLCKFSATNRHFQANGQFLTLLTPFLTPWVTQIRSKFSEFMKRILLSFLSCKVTILHKFSATKCHFQANGQFLTLLTPFLTPWVTQIRSKFSEFMKRILLSFLSCKVTILHKFSATKCHFQANGQFLTLLAPLFDPWGAQIRSKFEECLEEMLSSFLLS